MFARLEMLTSAWLSAAALALMAALSPAPVGAEEERRYAELLRDAWNEARPLRDSNSCNETNDRLVQILCDGAIRIGVREGYPLFGDTDKDGERAGYEIEIAHEIARRFYLGEPEFTTIAPKDRISTLANGAVDLVIATMGHTTRRDTEVEFIRPHYFASRTSVVGRIPDEDSSRRFRDNLNEEDKYVSEMLKDSEVSKIEELIGKTVCVTVGNYSNARLSEYASRLMLFDKPERLVSALQASTCGLVAQDDAFFASYFASEEPIKFRDKERIVSKKFSELFEEKFGYQWLPWGMAVAKRYEKGNGNTEKSADTLVRVLGLVVESMHADGTLLRLASGNPGPDDSKGGEANGSGAGIQGSWLISQRDRWNGDCGDLADRGEEWRRECLLEPSDTTFEDSAIKPQVVAFEKLVNDTLGVKLEFSFLHTEIALNLFLDGLVITLIAVVAVLGLTMFFSLCFAGLLATQIGLFTAPVRLLASVLQGTPPLMTLVFAGALANAALGYSAMIALIVALVALGMMNGAFAGAAIFDAWQSAANAESKGESSEAIWRKALARSSGQIEAFLINGAKGTAVASFIGVPEMVNTLNDVTAFSSSQQATYWFLLLFYFALVQIVAWASAMLRRRLERLETVT